MPTSQFKIYLIFALLIASIAIVPLISAVELDLPINITINVESAVLGNGSNVSQIIFPENIIIKQYSSSILKAYCIDEDNNFCNENTTCDMTINYPNSSNMVSDSLMLYNPVYFNYPLSSSQTSVLGTYEGIVFCYGITNAYTNFHYEVTPTGLTQNSVFENSILLILLLISITFLIIALYIRSYPLGFLSGILFTLSGIYTMLYGFNNYTDDFTRAVGFVLIGLGAIFVLASGYEGIMDARDSGIMKGEEESEE
jgi:hypothetical protein